MTKTRRLLLARLALLVGGFFLAACSNASTGSGATTGLGATGVTGTPDLSPGEVVTDRGAEPGVVLRHPVEGRLNGDQFSLNVLAYGVTPSVAANGYVPPAGYTLAVVEYDLEYYDDNAAQPTLSFVAGGTPYPVDATDLSVLGSGEASAVAAVPRGEPVSFAASLDGVTQTFSFTTGSRGGPSPAVLYRDAGGRPDVTADVQKTVTLPVDVPADGGRSAVDLTLSSATLSWFSPVDPAAHPRSAAGAFLVVSVTDDQGGSALDGWWSSPMPPQRMSLVLPSGTVLHPDPASNTQDAAGFGLLNGEYFYDVPASFVRGTLVITPGTGTTAGGSTATVLGSARFPIVFPPPPARTPPPRHGGGTPKGSAGSPTSTTARPTTTTVGPASGTGRDEQPVATVLVGLSVLLLVGVVAGSVLLVRRRRRRPGRRRPQAVDTHGKRVHPPPALPYLHMAALMPGAVPLPPVAAADPSAPVTSASREARDEASAPLPTDDAPVVVYVLGPVTVSGFERPPKRAVLTAILCYLAFHKDRPRRGAELRAALWPAGDDFDSEEAAANTLHNYVSMLRRAAGQDKVPKAGSSGYRVTDAVETDWERFQALTAAARARPAEAVELLRAALSMVRGTPFEGAGERYEWASIELVPEIEVAVVRAASELASLELAAGRAQEAIAALRAGLRVSPDHDLCALLLDAAAAVDPSALERAWRDVGHLLGAGAARLRPHYESLRSDDAELPH